MPLRVALAAAPSADRFTMDALLRGRAEAGRPEIAIELYFDEKTERAVVDLRSILYEEGIVPEPGIIEARPHLSLTILQGNEIPFDLLREFASVTEERPVRFSTLSTFPGADGVLFLAPTPDDRLLDLHRDLHERLHRSAFASREVYRPESWIPHCTLEKDIPESQLAEAFLLCKRAFRPIEGRLVEVGAVRFPPLEAVEIARLGEPAELGAGGAERNGRDGGGDGGGEHGEDDGNRPTGDGTRRSDRAGEG